MTLDRPRSGVTSEGAGMPWVVSVLVSVGTVIWVNLLLLSARAKKQETRWNPLTDGLLASLCAFVLDNATMAFYPLAVWRSWVRFPSAPPTYKLPTFALSLFLISGLMISFKKLLSGREIDIIDQSLV